VTQKIAARVLCTMMTLAIALTATTARAEWWEARTSHFIIYSETKREDAEGFARELERFDNALRSMQNMPVPGPDVGDANRLKVFRTGDTDRLGYILNASGAGIGGIYFPRAGNPVSFVPAREKRSTSRHIDTEGPGLDIKSTLFHEYTHHFMLSNFSTAYPHWYTEGFAELYSTVDYRGTGKFYVGLVPQHRGEALKALSDVKLTRLFDTKAKLTGLEYFQSYTYGWMLTHYLNFNEARRGQLPAYLGALNKGEDSLTAAKRIFGDLEMLQREVRKYKNGPFPGYEMQVGSYVEPNVTMRRMTPAEEAVIQTHMRSLRGVTPGQARDVARDLAGKSAAHPDSLFVQLAVTEAEIDAGNFDAADAAADRALAIAAGSSLAQYWKGLVFLGRGEKDKSAYAAARPYLIRARRLDPNDPRPAIAYYRSFYDAGEAVPEPAMIALEEVFPYAAYDREYRLLLGRQLIDEKKGDIARSVLAPIAFGSHSSDEENPLQAVIAAIDAKNMDEARAKMAEIFKKAKDARDGKDRR
jgi:tetratricopeptide (TPR) repeat protein